MAVCQPPLLYPQNLIIIIKMYWIVYYFTQFSLIIEKSQRSEFGLFSQFPGYTGFIEVFR